MNEGLNINRWLSEDISKKEPARNKVKTGGCSRLSETSLESLSP